MSKGKAFRLLFVILLLIPMIILQGLPGLSPAWLSDRLGDIPVIFYFVALWFAIIVIATWIPLADEADA